MWVQSTVLLLLHILWEGAHLPLMIGPAKRIWDMKTVLTIHFSFFVLGFPNLLSTSGGIAAAAAGALCSVVYFHIFRPGPVEGE